LYKYITDVYFFRLSKRLLKEYRGQVVLPRTHQATCSQESSAEGWHCRSQFSSPWPPEAAGTKN